MPRRIMFNPIVLEFYGIYRVSPRPPPEAGASLQPIPPRRITIFSEWDSRYQNTYMPDKFFLSQISNLNFVTYSGSL